ncbi:glycosyl hydrolase [Spirosoma radiotolerans]|uniref:Glycoside hydrolase n=1 Tax=Spirosoma radiotolerans TaxID=1379870 RepID=A0A0E3V668_9BACT|nr:glycosyl hydrolase [Spirosoma radiotolerans]AKD54767.1 glycoside hydrolase [Spirosoma radiotolerans]
MRSIFFAGLLLALGLNTLTISSAQPRSALTGQQPAPSTARPWTYWWWMGNAVNEADITHQLEQFAQAGIGGVHIIPIYGVKGYENQFIPFLTDRWLAVFAHTVREGKRLNMGVDLTTGTGWPFGGPGVSTDMAAKQWVLEKGKLTATLTKQQVKRPAPGGQGLVIDYFSKQALEQYLRRFDSTLAHLPEKPRSVYNDSYEVYGANWTDNFLTEFRTRRGYDLNSQLAAFLDTTQTAISQLVHQDYHQTLAELLLDGFAKPWANWAHKAGYKTRNQAHGSPGNLIDLYAAADIPETESFGSSRFPIPGLRVDANYEVDRFGTPNPLAMKFASSAAHLLGKPLVSSETGTWLANHFQVSLSQVKPQVDELFASGVNHVFYHGIPYSPPAETWPGWLFYASTNYGPTSHFWPHLPLLNQYIERCQTRLQISKPDNDVLVYFPIHDLWATPAKSAGGIHQLEVHHVERWLLPQPFGRLCEQLGEQGYAFDYVSDALLNSLTASQHGVRSPSGATYQIILVPRVTYIPETSLRQLAKLAQQGVRIVFDGQLPQQAAGFHNHLARSAKVHQLGKMLQKLHSVVVSPNVFETMKRLNIRVESWAAEGLSFIRKRQSNGHSTDTTQYFITNLSDRFHQNWLTLSATGQVIRYNPLTNQQEPMPIRKGENGQNEVFLQLEPGESCFINVHSGTPVYIDVAGQQRLVSQSTTPAIPLQNPWQVQFERARPALARPAKEQPDLGLAAPMSNLVSWTTRSDSAGYFSGTARYTTTFDLPNGVTASRYVLDLGDVREVADVRLNGQPVGTAWCLPFRLSIPANRLKASGNQLDVAVTNLSANYMRLYDRQHPDWKKFYDINIVDIRYKPFDATTWDALPSGLLGPVTLTPEVR